MKLSSRVIQTARAMNRLGINIGSSGNVSARQGDGFLITPTGMNYADLADADLVLMSAEGDVIAGSRRPSSEWLFHLDIYARRAEFGAIVHVHSRAATALACLREPIPSFHYMVASAGGTDIRCAEYALFGTQELSAAVLVALHERRACLLANHGLVACGVDLPAALDLAVEVEQLATQYLLARQSGQPVLLTEGEMAEVMKKFAGYGQQPSGTD
ncbi:MAG: class II aldolase [Gammaproteobacteria bacterium]|nr:MAG: class II aldolase [Gammaproteobacteria bacterium]RLA18136.1 MAG: class II aldolase [Gammaproteobacteria bacterium]